jgi:leucyl aminopeptidase
MYAVGKGASAKSQPNLLILEYNGDKSSGFATALVGKGLVMDTGGLNIKPYGNMETMNQDMGGAAACFGAFKSCVELGLERNIVCVLGFANNACGPNAFQPSEILRSLKGTTVEILNTDAEGRLVLADALTYVQKHADTTKTVDTLIDVATLTGACVVALGETRAGLFSNDARLARSLIAASERSLEPVWPMPIGSEHHKQMKGTLSDLINCAPGRWGGACNAAAFLHHFIEENKEISLQDQDKFPPAATSDLQTDLSGAEGKSKTKKSQETKKAVAFNKWAHLDIAGPGMGVKGTDRNPDGSTGFGVSLLTEYFRQQE